MISRLSFHSPVGDLTISEQDGALVMLCWGWARDQASTPLLMRTRDQVRAYFDGRVTRFDLPLRPSGTAYQQKIWAHLAEIPYGVVTGYAALAAAAGGSARSAGSACGANPLPIIVPCHRVVGVAGLGGYSGDGGLETKAWLLRQEERHACPRDAA